MNFSPLTIRMSHPCALDWDQLEPGEKDRYCEACGKNIIDFSKFTDAELFQYFQCKPSGICGRFTESQIHRELYPNIAARIRIKAKRILTAAILGAGIFTAGYARVQSTEVPHLQTLANYHIKGLIMLEGTNEPAIMARVTLYEHKRVIYTFFTDAKGMYNLEIDSNLLPAVSHITIESHDNRVRYEEDVTKAEILSFFNRAIPFYASSATTINENSEEIKTKESGSVDNEEKNRKKWNPFRKRRYYRFRPMGCPEF